MEFVSVIAIIFVGWCATAERAPDSSPDYLIVGKNNGDILRCLLENPTKCELLDNVDYSVKDITVYGGYLFVSNTKGTINKCSWHNKRHCEIFHDAHAPVFSFIVTGGFLYLAVNNNNHTLFRCPLTFPYNCSAVHTLKNDTNSLYEHDNFIYVQDNLDLWQCSKKKQIYCQSVEKEKHGRIGAIRVWEDCFVAVSPYGGIYIYNTSSNMYTLHAYHYYTYARIFKGIIYAIVTKNNLIRKCQLNLHCLDYVQHKDVNSISFVYSTHSLQRSYPRTNIACAGQTDPLVVFNYGEELRASLEVTVAGGLVVDARGAPLDTRAADRGYSGPAAVFAMGPGGQLLASAAHGSGLVGVASLLAGGPVAGAGEIVVENGVIKKVVACAQHYRADVKLNQQVVQELYSRGYTREIQLEECDYTCGSD